MFTQKFIKIFHSVQEIGLFSLFQNLNLGYASANPIHHLIISWATSGQYQCVFKILSKYSKRFKSYRHFSRTGWWENLLKQAGDKIKCLIIGHTMKVNLQFQLTFFGSCNFTAKRWQLTGKFTFIQVKGLLHYRSWHNGLGYRVPIEPKVSLKYSAILF